MSKAVFLRKPIDVEELKSRTLKPLEGAQFVIEEIVELTPDEYTNFSSNLLDDYPFIQENIEAMYMDQDGVYHCIYVKAEGSSEGILVESEGYDYARYAAYITEPGYLTETVKKQLLRIRDSGKVNMLDIYGVQREAYINDYFELALFIDEHKKEYIEFIFYGK